MTPLSLTYHDINEAYFELQTIKTQYAQWEDTRNGPALVFQAPVIIAHTVPERCVLFDPVRDANPFFHYMEAIWMLAGSEDASFPSKFAKNIANYSDDGATLHGAYGWRWRNHWDFDQLDALIQLLRREPHTRRAVLSMWDPVSDLGRDSKDLPCNTQVYFQAKGSVLNMTVTNRSNDLVWGCLGANAVHMAALHEYVAGATNMYTGTYYQFTNNLHIYEGWTDRYSPAPNRWYTAARGFQRWKWCPDNLGLAEAQRFVEMGLDTDVSYASRILRDNATPMLKAWTAYKGGDINEAIDHAEGIFDRDWNKACVQWLQRRLVNVQDEDR
jgi:thymidylate synthase